MLSWIPLAAALVAAAPQAAPADAKVAAIAPFLGEETAAAARLDLTTFDPRALARQALGDLADDRDVAGPVIAAGAWTGELKAAGAKELFVLIDPADFPGPPIVVVPLPGGGDGAAVIALLTKGNPGTPVQWPAAEVVRGAVVAGTPDAVARVKAAKPAARPELIEALAAAGDAPIRIAIAPSAVQLRAIEESMPNLPPAFGGGPITDLTRGLRWASIAPVSGDHPALRAVIRGRDAASAEAMKRVVQGAIASGVQALGRDPMLAELAKALNEIEPQVEGDRVVLSADLEKMASVAAIPINQAREAARRSQSMNNLKQIGLAMHNYHTNFNSFPPAFSAGPGGKPLLSWRVHVLPYVEELPLYKEFHLDEPWDSPHNKALIPRMPKTYACPSANGELAAEGKTTYLAPRGPATIFPGAEGVKIQDITDGTSNTILVVDAPDDAAVIWTKPDDWEMPDRPEGKALTGHHRGGFNALFADGSVKFLMTSIAPATLRAIFTRNGGEVISADAQ